MSVLTVLPVAAGAASFDFKILIDADANAASGCTVVLPAGSNFAGADAQSTVTVAVDDATAQARVTGVVLAPCMQGTFGPPATIDSTSWSAAGPNLVVESRLSLTQLRGVLPSTFPLAPRIRLGYVVTPATGTGGDAITADEGSPILFPPTTGKRHAVGPTHTIRLDGQTSDWGRIDAYPPDESAYRGAMKLVGAYATAVGPMLYFRFDAGLGGGSFRALPAAFPTEGPVPLTVTFVSNAEYAGVQIFRYRWDFDGDGVFDADDPGAASYTRTFTTPGVRNAVLAVTSDKGHVATATIRINVTGAPPEAFAAVNPSNGAVPLTVACSGSAYAGATGIASYEWDFNGDGRFDSMSTSSGNTSHVYTIAGTYNAAFRVTDKAGVSTTVRSPMTIVRAGPPGTPTARITAPTFPLTRLAPATVAFFGTATTPSGTITKYEWDFDGDGKYDSSSATTASATTEYRSPGTYAVAFRITNSSGLTSVATAELTIEMDVSLVLKDNTLTPPGSAFIETTISGTAPITMFIRNSRGETVRTLVNNATRFAGTYVNAWNGLDDKGVLVPEGVYYVILRYDTANGIPVFFDLTHTTGNDLYNPRWTLSTTKGGYGPCSDLCFAPYENNLLQATFGLDRASEVTVSIRGFESINEAALLFSRRLFGSDRSYTITWDGTDAHGEIVHPSLYGDSQFIFGMTALSLPDNAIFIEVAPELTDVAVTPNYYDPFTSDFLGPQRPPAKVSYKLSKPATVRLQVYRVGTNVLMRTVDRVNAPVGDGTISWDGRDDHGIFADKGDYRLSLKAIDAAGNQSLVRYALMKVFY